MDIQFKSDGREDSKNLVVASSGMRTRNKDWFTGRHIRPLPAGIRTASFSENPVLLWSHDKHNVPIGRANVSLENNKLVAGLEFHKKTEESRLISELWEEKFLNAVSVSLSLSKDDIENIIETEEEVVLATSELAEISVVTVPADPGAIRQFLQSRQDNSTKAVDSILQSLEESEDFIMDQEELVESEVVEDANIDTTEDQEDAGEALFELDEDAISQLSKGLGITDISQGLGELVEYVNGLEQRLAQLEGEPVVRKRVTAARFSFSSDSTPELPKDLPAPGKTRGGASGAFARQLSRMNGAK